MKSAIAIHFGAAFKPHRHQNDMVIRRASSSAPAAGRPAHKNALEAYFKDRIIIVGTVPGYTLTEEHHSVDMIF